MKLHITVNDPDNHMDSGCVQLILQECSNHVDIEGLSAISARVEFEDGEMVELDMSLYINPNEQGHC
jgi:hypothetical protein